LATSSSACSSEAWLGQHLMPRCRERWVVEAPPLDVPCAEKWCLAPVGEPCHSKGRPVEPHWTRGRRKGEEGAHKNCANCIDYALWWRRRLMRQIGKFRRVHLDDMLALGRRLADARRARGLSQRDVARMIGTSSQGLGQVEQGWRRPSREWLERLAAVLGVGLD
jgi:DNA-binding XRE family transcriptional regulator